MGELELLMNAVRDTDKQIRDMIRDHGKKLDEIAEKATDTASTVRGHGETLVVHGKKIDRLAIDVESVKSACAHLEKSVSDTPPVSPVAGGSLGDFVRANVRWIVLGLAVVGSAVGSSYGFSNGEDVEAKATVAASKALELVEKVERIDHSLDAITAVMAEERAPDGEETASCEPTEEEEAP